jgi:recombination associated protein RdgC
MGFLAASASICHFQVTGSFKQQDIHPHIQQQLAAEGFRSIENSADELATGWVHLDDYDSSDFATPQSCWRDRHLCFTLRQDRRRIPAALFKRQVAQLCGQFLAEKPNLNRVPKGELEQIRDRARSLLMARTLPNPSCCDVIWDYDRQLLRLCSLSQKVLENFQALFHQTFPGLRLQLIHPLARAALLIPEARREQLQHLNQAQTDSALEQIEANRWLGYDFLQWLLYRTLNSDSRYQVGSAGPLLDRQPFTAYLDNRLVLVGGGQEGVQKVVVAGPQDQFAEVRAALRQGKQIEEATLHLQQGEDNSWKLTLKGERFQFGGYRTPMVKPDRDPNDDPQAEAEAAFFTKLGAVEEGEQMFDSLLKMFLELRLGDGWKAECEAIGKWLEE